MVDRHLDGAVLADLGLDLQGDTHVFALNGLEGIDCARSAAGARVGELAGHKGHVLRNDDLRFFVVQRQQIGGGQDIAVATVL